MNEQASFLANARDAILGRLRRAFPGHYGLNTKHNFACDYGWPEYLTFDQYYRLYTRSGLAAAAVDKTIAKTWQSYPDLWESEEPGNSETEAGIKKHFRKRNIWRGLMEADRRSMVGHYAGAIIYLRDNKPLAEPVERVSGGIEAIAGVAPAWEKQLTPIEWDNDPFSDRYGHPVYYEFYEQAINEPLAGSNKGLVRIHHSRILIWSSDGTLNGRSSLEPGYNDVIDADKIKGAGGEGFWKSSRGAPIIEAPNGVSPQDVMRSMGAASSTETIDKLNDQVEKFQQGFDNALMLGGFNVKPLNISLSQPKEFWQIPAQSFAASVGMPFKILVGNITGERASTEDAKEWNETCASRRENRVIPILNDFIDRLVDWGVLEDGDWTIGWGDLRESSPADKILLAKDMAEVNKADPSNPAFLVDEIREAAGFSPADEVDGFQEALAEVQERKRLEAEDDASVIIEQEEAPA